MTTANHKKYWKKLLLCICILWMQVYRVSIPFCLHLDHDALLLLDLHDDVHALLCGQALWILSREYADNVYVLDLLANSMRKQNNGSRGDGRELQFSFSFDKSFFIFFCLHHPLSHSSPTLLLSCVHRFFYLPYFANKKWVFSPLLVLLHSLSFVKKTSPCKRQVAIKVMRSWKKDIITHGRTLRGISFCFLLTIQLFKLCALTPHFLILSIFWKKGKERKKKSFPHGCLCCVCFLTGFCSHFLFSMFLYSVASHPLAHPERFLSLTQSGIRNEWRLLKWMNCD